LVYTNWSGSEPNDAGGNEDAAAMYDGGVWNDLDVGFGPSGYLVEYETSSAIHSTPLTLQLTGATTLSVQGVRAGMPQGEAVSVQLLGSMQTQVYYNDANQVVGIVLLDSQAAMANGLSGFLDLAPNGGFDFSIPNATAKVFQSLLTGNFSTVNPTGIVNAEGVFATFPTGVVSYSPTGGYMGQISPGSFALSDFGTLNAAIFAGPITPIVTTLASATPGMKGVKLELPLSFDVGLVDNAGVRINLNLEAVGEFAIVPEPSGHVLAGSGVLAAMYFVAGAKRRRLATKR
jgi:hypothetical protein